MLPAVLDQVEVGVGAGMLCGSGAVEAHTETWCGQEAEAAVDGTDGGGADDVETDYPASGRVTVRVDEGPARSWRLEVRVPGWNDEIRLSIGDEAWSVTPAAAAATRGDATVERTWQPGDELHVDLPVRPRWTYPASQVDAVRGCVAVERGPLVYCAESPAADTSAEDISALRVDDSSAPTDRSDGTVRAGEPPLDLIPYHRWGNRGPATMRVWLPLAARRRP